MPANTTAVSEVLDVSDDHLAVIRAAIASALGTPVAGAWAGWCKVQVTGKREHHSHSLGRGWVTPVG